MLSTPKPRRVLLGSITLIVSFALPARAEEQPSAALLRAINTQLQLLDVSAVKGEVRFDPGPLTSPACGMLRFTMNLSNRDKSRSFQVLIEPPPVGSDPHPKQLLAVTRTLHVDADGSPRGYHPDDPGGKGSCVLDRGAGGAFIPRSGTCALDPLANAGVRLFAGETRLTGNAFTAAWPAVWKLIAERRLRPLDASTLENHEALSRYYGFYWPDRSATVLFKRDIILPDRDGYPCVRGGKSNYPGYFVAATTLSSSADGIAGESAASKDIAPAECRANRFIDAEQVPFFVIPGGSLGEIGIGDIAIVYVRDGGGEKIIYAVVGDSGPSVSFGEGSIALNQRLLGQTGRAIMNNVEANKLDIGPSRRLAVGVLLLGGTRDFLNEDYSAKNIESVGQRQLLQWSGGADGHTRLGSCFDAGMAPR